MEMFPTFDTRIILLLYTLLQGLTGLRLNKISIPAYRLRGESAFLECQYELDRPTLDASKSNNRHQYNQRFGGEGGVGGAAGGGSEFAYIDTDSVTAGDESTINRDLRTYPYVQQQQQQQHQQQQRYHRQQKQQQQQEPYHYFNSGERARARGRRGGNYRSQHQAQAASAWYSARSYDNEERRAGRWRQTAWQEPAAAGLAARRSSIQRDAFKEERNDEGDDDEDENEDEDADEALYAVKWYKDNEEFYRYVPRANPAKQSYRVDGIRVIEEHSDSTRVLLRGLTLNSTGLYRCEVSAEAPNFSSVQGEGRMEVVYLPRDGPHIKGQQVQYQIGEILNLNCSSGKSHPASHLQWFINEQSVTETHFLVRYNNTIHKHGLITTTLGLRLTVRARHFLNGAMKVKCLASITPVLWKGGKESVLQRRPGIIDNREAMLLVHSRATDLHQLQSQTQQNLVNAAVTFSLLALRQLLLSRQVLS